MGQENKPVLQMPDRRHEDKGLMDRDGSIGDEARHRATDLAGLDLVRATDGTGLDQVLFGEEEARALAQYRARRVEARIKATMDRVPGIREVCRRAFFAALDWEESGQVTNPGDSEAAFSAWYSNTDPHMAILAQDPDEKTLTGRLHR